ncbi:uncharacterized protein [Prorops nasuta]|uniref:uncharacterized protein n=1 Tax=Prorops nasuta TaxID=863751 RepID=UPI0034CF09EF
MRKCNLVSLVYVAWATTATIFNPARAEAEAVLGILSPQYENRQSIDPRPRLSASQQAQILSDVQQHQQLLLPAFAANTPYSSLAKYKVDRSKQQQQQQQQNRYHPITSNQYQNTPPGAAASGRFENLASHDLNQPFFTNEQSLQLQTYLEKQRELELLHKQRQQLLLEQQELRRQQEVLRLQQLQALTSTTLSPLIISTASLSSTPIPTSTAAPTPTSVATELFLKAIANHERKFSSSTTTERPVQKLQEPIPDHLLSFIGNRNTAPTKARTSGEPETSRDLLLKQLKIALAQSGDNEGTRNVTTRDLILPNGKKLQVIHAPAGLASIGARSKISTTTTTIKPPKAILDELTKGVLPPGADFEVIRQKSDGNLEEVGKQSLPAKKVTFVVLEEQADGSYKVQGVKGNVDKETSDVDSIVERIKKGELKLPPSSRSPPTPTPTPRHESNGETGSVSTRIVPTTSKITQGKSNSDVFRVTTSPNLVSSTDKYATSASSFSGHFYNSIGTLSTTPRTVSSGSTRSQSQFVPTIVPVSSSEKPKSGFSYAPTDNRVFDEYEKTTVRSNLDSDKENIEPTFHQDSLTSLLRREGLFAMAKYLRQSGLDTVLNETGPYTIFVPTDKAFRTLLVQLGGPEKAEQKFKDNPRLLSGLLLHHVIPGAFRIDSLQDEMTGVSLAGTQLRVNEYAMHDHEWNDVKVTTINGARVAPNKRDVEIPQGIAHAVDRVMFPLPVGDLVQTLQADRERRFSTFMKMLHASGLEDTLAGPKTFTIFAPTDTAFANAASKQGGPIWSEVDGAEAAKAIISKHVVPTTLYTAGMRYYIQKDSLRPQAPLHIHKNGGRVRVNEAHVITHNVPATNGVLHAIDGVL